MLNLKIDWPKTLTEFLIIVVGVLAALGVDEWRGEREDRTLEASYLQRLRVDINRDLATFAAEAIGLEKKAAFLQSLIDRTTEQQFEENPRALMEAKVTSSFRGVPAVVRTTFDELLSTGRLALIRDTEIRTAISEYYADYASFEEQVNNFTPGEYVKLVNGLVPGKIARDWRLSNTISQPQEFSRSLRKLEEHPRLSAAANSEISYASALQFYLLGYAGRANELLRLLEQRGGS